ncbi:MAG: hypothetical protein G01um101438_326 [Parcubacteria group bacterium Gr01-1014_38]|nr:MAG: hypothetical protein G01um101438_326 [Parcubacteria group bacterium Gr01-1014_38]
MGKKAKFCCAIYMGKYGINVYSNDPGTFDILRTGAFVPFIPGYRCLKRRARSDYSIVYIRDTVCSAQVTGAKKLEIRAPLTDVVRASTIPFRAHFMLEPQLQKDSIFTSQGGGVSKNGRAVLLMGKRGAGKTSVTLELCRKYHWRLVGNDLILVGFRENAGYLFGGAKAFTLRFTTVKYYNADLQKLFPKNHPNEWTNKITLLAEGLGISAERGHPKLTNVFYLHLLNDKAAPLYLRRIGSKKTAHMGRLYLYEELSSYIRGVSAPVVYGPQFSLGDYLPSLDKPEYHQNRVKLIDWIMDDVGFYFISGSMRAICEHVNAALGHPK